MIQTMSSPNDWLQFYNQNRTNTQPIQDIANINTITTTTAATTVAAATSSPPGMFNSGSPGSTHLSPEGRVAKPTRRRSRASRRTPTTLLNTDTTNFRAMVQQFTGGPTAPFAHNPLTAPQVLPNLVGFGFPSRPVPNLNPTTLMVSPPPIFQQQQQQQQQHVFHPHNQQYDMYNSGATASSSQGGDNTFFQRISSNNNNNPIRYDDHPAAKNADAVLNMDHGRFFPNTSSS